jgi:hypothetical protein
MLTTRTISLPEQMGAEEGLLVFDDRALIAVLACVRPEKGECVRWHVEASFSPKVRVGTVIADVDRWINEFDQTSGR